MLSDPFKLLTLLHQLTLSLPELAELHAESQQWLDDNTILGRKGLNQAAQLTPQQKREELEASQPPAEEDGKPKPPRRTIFLRAFGAPPAPHRPSEN
jgi:hypothetical protein